MISLIFKIFAGINALIGLTTVASAVWPSADPSTEKTPLVVIFYILWGVFFLGVAWAVFLVKPYARKWTIVLYIMAFLSALWSLVSDIISQDMVFVHFPWVSLSVYLLFFAFFIAPIIFMLRPDVKDYMAKVEEDRIQAEIEGGRATFKNKS